MLKVGTGGKISLVPAPKKITPDIAAELLRRRDQGVSARALEREFGISNQAIGKFFRKEDAKRAAELEGANQPARATPSDGGRPLEQPQPPGRPSRSGEVPEFASPEERFAYYEGRRLVDPPYSIWDSNDVRHGRLTAAERRQLRRPR